MVAIVFMAISPAAGQGMWGYAPAPPAARPNPENYRPGMKMAIWLTGDPQNGGLPQGRPPVMRYSMCNEYYVTPFAYFMHFLADTGDMPLRIERSRYVTILCEGMVYVAKPGQHYLGVEFCTGNTASPEELQMSLDESISNLGNIYYQPREASAGARLDVYVAEKSALRFPWQSREKTLSAQKLLHFSRTGYYPLAFVLVAQGNSHEPAFRVSFRHVDDEGMNYSGADGFFLPGTSGTRSEEGAAPAQDDEALLIN